MTHYFERGYHKKLSILLALAVGVSTVYFLMALPAIWHPAKSDKQTLGLTKQTAIHLSKLLGGESVGGFPGFEPSDDDPAYQKKIRERNYTAQDANDWLKEINTYLQQIVKRNPNQSLVRILRKSGLDDGEIRSFVDALKDVYEIAKLGEGFGIHPTTLLNLERLLIQLKVL